jgi:hypothetical protein
VRRDLERLKEQIAPSWEMEEFMAHLRSDRGQRFLERMGV